MSLLTAIEGRALPLPIDNLDTDQIMPKQFLRGIDKAGLAPGLLHDLRFDAGGAPRADSVLNDARHAGARVLIGGANFGCGSSREHAVWGLLQYGFAAVIAPSFAEIFHSNAMNNRLLLVTLARDEVDALAAEAVANPDGVLRIDIEWRQVASPAGRRFDFALGARHQRMVIEGIDTIDLTLAMADRIDAFEQRHRAARPWAQLDATRATG
ncbi:3-isopropylmalate dehydratase small subunit [Burkholderia plantarii]|uniref:3-isopropylmalate dehydratase small subunit n=1 Tax=Burkholderia plantarii TaxID=41899 RepID=UPI0006D889B0|nr:3-isopropylmalate dehydratase small subunit [Burkholderia plantarii]ALK34000.1 3-isopropylmalate dehydratase, small subunit [Burkholderia plantarii]GLZ22188.1 3-isopropylmalate dehydratase small subunit [Burkholderia plantarii]